MATQIAATTGNERVQSVQLDLADLRSIARFVDGWVGPLHILVNNAAVMALPERTLTSNGWEMQFATNHLGHFALATGLHHALAAAGDATIVSVSSRGHFHSPVDFEDPNFTARPYDRWTAYGQSKTANVLFAVAADARWAGDGIVANAVFPGIVLETGLARHVEPAALKDKAASPAVYLKTIEQGAATTVFVATAPEARTVRGHYFEDCRPAAVLADTKPDAPGGVAAYAVDPVNADRLWALSERLVGTQR